MSDQIIIIVIIAVVFFCFAAVAIGSWKIGRRLSAHLMVPPRRHGRSDKDIDKIIEDRVEAALARRDAR